MSTRGERLRQALVARGVRKQQALAAQLNVHESAITRWKENAAMSLDSAMSLASVLDVSLDWLLLGRGTIDSHNARNVDAVQLADLQRLGTRVSPKTVSLLLSL